MIMSYCTSWWTGKQQQNKLKKSKASSDSDSEDKKEHFNFKNFNIGEERQTARTLRIDDAEVPEKGTEAEKGLCTIIHAINPGGGGDHYVPILLENANIIVVKAKYHTLRILLDSGAIYLLVLGKQTQKLRHKKTHPVRWSTQGGDFLTTHKTNVELVLPELDAMESVTWSFHVDD